jgi:phosphate transport system permease protein
MLEGQSALALERLQKNSGTNQESILILSFLSVPFSVPFSRGDPMNAPVTIRKTGSSAADRIFQNIIVGLAGVVLLTALVYCAVLLWRGAPAFAKEGFGFVFGSNWDPANNSFQALPFIAGTFLTALGALVIAVPLALGSSLFVAEYAPPWLAGPVAALIELLAAIPSVVYGLWGIFVLIPSLQPFQAWLAGLLGQPAPVGPNLFAAIMVLAVMVIPFIAAISRDVIKLVPNDQREAYALGATKWEVIRFAILPYARAGILGGVILGLGRAIGETLAVTMVIGNANRFPTSLFQPAATMSSIIASNFGEATTSEFVSSLIAIGFVLFVASLIVNFLARIVIAKLTPHGIS